MRMVLLVIAAFVAGAVPFGVLIARARGVAIQDHGSGNIGATNVTRVLGVRAGALVLVLDASKGALPTYLALRLCGGPWIVVAAGAAAILGHCFSPFLRGHGGKGVATALGVFTVLTPTLIPIALGVFVVVLTVSRVPALGSLAAVAAMAAILVVHGVIPSATLAVATLVLLVYTHRSNLAKLRRR